jgi:hypothetical protein
MEKSEKFTIKWRWGMMMMMGMYGGMEEEESRSMRGGGSYASIKHP